MKTSSVVKILMPALAALVACQAGFAQAAYAVVPTAAPGHFRPYVWRMNTPIRPNFGVYGPAYCNTNAFYSFTFCPRGLQSVYGANSIPSGNGGRGKTIAIVDAFHYAHAASDLATFNTAMGLPQLDGVGTDPTLTIVGCTDVSGAPPTPPSYGVTCASPSTGTSNPGWEVEEMLDLEYAHAMAPYANILMVEAYDNGGSLFGAVYYAESNADIVSNSWGGAESAGQTSADTTFGQGKPILFSSGDTGDEVCIAFNGDGSCKTYAVGVQYPCSSPNVTCVGGTTLLPSGSPLRRSSEVAWSGSGGGCSTQEGLPYYQNIGAIGGGGAPSVCNSGGSWRAVPDIAAVADPSTGVMEYDSGNGGYFQVGGTSLATPVTAGLFAQIIAARHTFGQATIPYFNPALYPAAIRNYPYFFFDIVSGSNGYPAGTGYDLVTGLGVSNIAAMANRFFGLIFVLD